MARARRFVLLIAVTLAAASAACTGSLEDLLTFEETVEQSITVPGGGIGINNPLAPDDVFPIDFGDLLGSQLQQSFETQDIDKDLVSSLTVTAMSVEVTNPDEAGNGRIVNSMEFLERLAFTLGNENTAEGEAVLVAESADGAFDTENIIQYDFPVTDNELVDVLQGGNELVMDTELETEPPPDDRPLTNADLNFSVTLSVVANPAGAL
jgi:hypothetical protein